jgi:hypothetical protein
LGGVLIRERTHGCDLLIGCHREGTRKRGGLDLTRQNRSDRDDRRQANGFRIKTLFGLVGLYGGPLIDDKKDDDKGEEQIRRYHSTYYLII